LLYSTPALTALHNGNVLIFDAVYGSVGYSLFYYLLLADDVGGDEKQLIEPKHY